MGKFVIIGERIHCISPVIKKAMEEMDPGPILQRGGPDDPGRIRQRPTLP